MFCSFVAFSSPPSPSPFNTPHETLFAAMEASHLFKSSVKCCIHPHSLRHLFDVSISSAYPLSLSLSRFLPLFLHFVVLCLIYHPLWAYTGGKPLFTHWVCAEYMVGSETKYPAWTHQVHFDYFYNLPPIHPPKYSPGTC